MIVKELDLYTLSKAKKALSELENRPENYYENYPPDIMDLEKNSIKELRKDVDYWEEKLMNVNKKKND